jgi:acetyltransferase-like isoleucine patch superfamily enzyme
MKIRSILSSITPHYSKRFLQNLLSKYKYCVSIGRGSHAHHTQFGKYCSIGTDTQVVSSKVGRSTYIANNANICFAKIGRFCAFGDNVRICLGNHPTKEIVSIHPAFYSCNGMGTPPYCKEEIFPGHKYIDQESRYVAKIGNDVWVGNDVRILDGVTIGDGAIVGLGSIVTKDVAPYSIVAGSPAKEIGKRFDEKTVAFLLGYKWWNKDEAWLRENATLFHSVDEFVEKLALK